jgi:mRNA-decapping enzyme 1B
MAGTLQIDINKLQNESLNILRKTDPTIIKVLANASHAANYSFHQATNEWKKRDIEGPFFVVERKATQQNPNIYAMIVLNRLNANNYVQYLNPTINFQVSDPYIIFRTQQETIGFWFGIANERNAIANIVQGVLQNLAIRSRIPPQQQQKAWQGSENASQHLLSMIKGGNNNNRDNKNESRNKKKNNKGDLSNLKPEDIELTKPQLQRMLIRMLEDDRFIGLLHQQYIQSLRKKKNPKHNGQ